MFVVFVLLFSEIPAPVLIGICLIREEINFWSILVRINIERSLALVWITKSIITLCCTCAALAHLYLKSYFLQILSIAYHSVLTVRKKRTNNCCYGVTNLYHVYCIWLTLSMVKFSCDHLSDNFIPDKLWFDIARKYLLQQYDQCVKLSTSSALNISTDPLTYLCTYTEHTYTTHTLGLWSGGGQYHPVN